MLHLHTSNRYETLKAGLLAELARAPDDPFAMQEIIVPSMAVKRDLQLSLARTLGVASGQRFSFLAAWLWQRIGQLVTVREDSPFAPEKAAWRLFHLLGAAEDFRAHPALYAYLRAADPVMRLELARRVASLFETYVTYRPDWLAAWSRGQQVFSGLARPESSPSTGAAHEAWQMALWRRFAESLGTLPRHPSDAFFEALTALGDTGASRAGLPEAVHVFVLPTLPPLYLEILARLAGWMDVRLYLLNPCREYWLELVAQKRQNRLERAGRGDYLDDRYPLLAEWGRQTQALFGLILDALPDVVDDSHAHFVSPMADAAPSLLRRFQESILDLEAPEPGAWSLDAADRSVEIHVAHSLARQLEILRDQLRQRFEADPELRPADVLVALPDLDAAAPLIDAIFSAGAEETERLPCAITGCGTARANPVARFLLALMELAKPPARLPAHAVFALLREPPVSAALGLPEPELERLRVALDAAGMRWGLDGAARTVAGLPGTERHTWRDALSRLFLGYAMPADALPFQGVIPAGGLSGPAAETLGVLWSVLARLENLVDALARSHTATGWLRLWRSLLADWLGERLPAGEADALRAVHAVLDDLAANMAEAGPRALIPVEAAHAALVAAFRDAPHGGVPSGGIVFAALPSLRALPYRLVCLLDLGNDVFPGAGRPLEFDLTTLEARPGDRQRRDDDRNLFLDLILAARDGLYLGYTGRGQRDDAPLPPSILVSGFLEFLCRATGAAPERFVATHPLQAFSPLYFSDSRKDAKDAKGTGDARLVGYDAAYADALNRQAGARRTNPAPFFDAPLPDGQLPSPTLAELQRFFRHPARALLRRVGLALAQAEGETEDEEPLLADFPARDRLARRLLPLALSGLETDALVDAARAGPEWPEGRLGDDLLGAEIASLADYARRLRPRLEALRDEPLEFRLCLDGFDSFARIGDVTATGLLRYRYAEARAGDYLAAWLDHLCVLADGRWPENETLHVARDRIFRFRPLPRNAARAALLAWFAAWREGQATPLRFYPRTAWAWTTEGENKGRQTWWSDFQERGELDPWWSLALRGAWRDDPHEVLDARFHHWRETLLGPLLECLAD
ncbi:MAG: exodeoxyribonuclease V subunit gamma [Zoogloeaceae bacterium]|jgi:exodeoxyribonuclease V gamma subunit|nr:exodeoxyribonuclease V subunit gamma [Zoogloeaceae bacterium]